MTLIEIRERLKTNYFLDIVVIQQGFYCRAYEEDAKWMNKEWGWRIAEHKFKGEVKYVYTGFRSQNKKLYAKRFQERGLSYAIVGIKDYEMGVSKPPFERCIELSSDPKIIGMSFGFTGKASNKKTYLKKEIKIDASEFLEGIMAGVNILTGEQLGNDSAWNHQAIHEDIKDYLKSKK